MILVSLIILLIYVVALITTENHIYSSNHIMWEGENREGNN